MRHFLREKKSKISSFFFKKSLLRFLSLRYSADFRRSRLVFLQTTDLTLKGPLFTETTKTTKAKSGLQKLSPKGYPFHFLLFQGNLQNRTSLKGPFGFSSALCNFFRKIRGFWYFATECMLINPKGSPLLHFSALCNIFRKKIKNFVFFKKTFCVFWALDIAPKLHVLVLFYFFPPDLTLKGPLFCSFVQLELRMSKTYWIRQNLVQNKTDVQNLENIRRILVFLTSIFSALWDFYSKLFWLHQSAPFIFFKFWNRMDV